MANEKNLKKGNPSTQIRSGREAVEKGKKGGIASGKARREKKTIQNILNDYLDDEIKSSSKLSKVAKKAGLSNDKSIKELVTAVCIINTLDKGDVGALEKLSRLLGEDNGTECLEDISDVEADVFGG